MFILRTRALIPSIALLALALAPPALATDEPDSADDFKYLPADTDLLIMIRMDQLNAGDTFKKLCKEFPTMEQGIRKEFGLEFANVQRIVGNDKVLVIYLKNGITPETIAKAMGEPRFPKDKATTFKKETVNSLTVYVPETGDREAFCLVNDKTLVMSDTKLLKDVLARDKAPGLAPGLRAALKESDSTATVTIAMGSTGLRVGCKGPLIRQEIMTRTGVDIYELKTPILGVFLTAKVDRDVSLRGVVVCEKGQSAEEYKKFAAAIRAYGSKRMKELSLPKNLIEAMDKIQLSAKDNLAVATLTVTDDVAIAFIKAVFLPQD
jgi:hypothetical protein